MDSKTKSLKDVLGSMQTTLQCSICLDLLQNPVSTKCDHHYCRFCITEFLRTQASVPCPLCKCPITKRSLNDRPQLSCIVDDVRLLLEAFSKDTENKNSPPPGPSALSSATSGAPEQPTKSEARGTKRRLPGSDTKVILAKSTERRNVRQAKRKTLDIRVMENPSEETETGQDKTNIIGDDEETKNPGGNMLDSRTRSDVIDESNPGELTIRAREAESALTERTEMKSGRKGNTCRTVGPSEKTKRFTDQNIFSNLLGELQSERTKPDDDMDFMENQKDLESCDKEEVQGHSGAYCSPSRLTKMIKNDDVQLINREDAKGVSKVKAWLSSNPVTGKDQGRNKGKSNGHQSDSLTTDTRSEEEVAEDCGREACDLSKSITVQSVEDQGNKAEDDSGEVSVFTARQEIPEMHGNNSERAVNRSKSDSGAHRIFKATRNNHHAETSVRQEKGKLIFQKSSKKSVKKISCIAKSVQGKKSRRREPVKVRTRGGCKLREIDMNIMGSDSDPYEFKSSGTSPVQPKAKRIKLMEGRSKEGQINITIQCMPKTKSGKSILKQVTGSGMRMAEKTREGGGGKAKKLSPKALQRQKEEEMALEEMRDKISQVEDYDLLTCTQEVLDHMNKEKMGWDGSRKLVSFNQDVVFIGSQNQSSVRCLKGDKESDAVTNVCEDWPEKDPDVHVSTNEKDVARHVETKSDMNENDVCCGRDFPTTQRIESGQDEKSEENGLTGDIISLEKSESENEADDIETMSSSTTDLDIQPDNSEFETLNIDIQPEAVIEILNSQDLISNCAIKNGRNKIPVIENEIIADSEDHETFLKPKNFQISGQKSKTSQKLQRKKSEEKSKQIGHKERMGESKESEEILSGGCDGAGEYTEGRDFLRTDGSDEELPSVEVVPVMDECTGRRDEHVGSEKVVPVTDGQIGSVKVVPETPLLIGDSEQTVSSSEISSDNRTLCKSNRLKRGSKKMTYKGGKDNGSCELTQTQVSDSGVSRAEDTECSEAIIPPSWNEEISKEDMHPKESSNSSATYLSSETQESSLSCKRRPKRSLKCPSVRNSVLSEVYEILETPVSERFVATGDKETECESNQQIKVDVKPRNVSQQSLSSLSNTQESVSILATVHKPSNWTGKKQRPVTSAKDQGDLEKSSTDVGGTRSRKTAQVSEDVSSSCEIVSVVESITDDSSSNEKRRKGTVTRRPKRKCFSLSSPEKGELDSVAGQQRECDVREARKENADQRHNPESTEEDGNVQGVPDNSTMEQTAEIVHGGSGMTKNEVELVSTPGDAMIPTQLSLRSVRKRELRQRKRPQDSPEDVFLIDSEVNETDSCCQNQEGMLDLELMGTAEFCPDGDDVEKSCVGKAEISSGRKNQKKEAKLTPDDNTNADKNERESLENVHQKNLETDLIDNSSSMDQALQKTAVGSNGSEVHKQGRRPVRGLARKLKQKNKLYGGPPNDQGTGKVVEDCDERRRRPSTLSEETICVKDRIISEGEALTGDRNGGRFEKRTVDDLPGEIEEAGLKNFVPETVEEDGEEIEKTECDVLAIPETVEDVDDQVDDELPAIPETIDDNVMNIEKKSDINYKENIVKGDVEDEKAVDENVECIEESFIQEYSVDSSDSKKDTREISAREKKTDKLGMNDEPKLKTEDVDDIVEENREQLETVKEDSYMATGADDEPLFHSPESSPLPDILEEDYDLPQDLPTKQTCVQATRVILDEKEDENSDDDSDASSDFVLLSEGEDDVSEPRHKRTRSCHRADENDEHSDTGSDLMLLSDDARSASSHDEEEEEKDSVIRKQRSQRNLILSDDEEVIERKKTKKPVIISDDEEGDDERVNDSLLAEDEDLDLSQGSLSSRHTNLSSSAFSSQSEGCNTQKQAILRQELARMKKEIKEIESRIQEGNKSCEFQKTSQKPRSPPPSPESEAAVAEPYSQYLKELQQEESDEEFPDHSQKSVAKKAKSGETFPAEDESDLDLSPLTPSPPPADLFSGIDTELPEQFQETSNLLKHFNTSDKNGCSVNKRKEEEMEVDCLDLTPETIDPCMIPESPQGANDIAPSQSPKGGNFSTKDPGVVHESPNSQRSSKSSLERLKDLYHSTPVSSCGKTKGTRKNTLGFLSPVVAIPTSSAREVLKMKAAQTELSPLMQASQKSPKPYSFIASGLPLNQLNELRHLLKSNNCPLLAKFSSSTTHLIVKTEPVGSRTCDRTLKFFQAVANSCWILDFQWVVDSLSAGRLLKEDPYEIISDTVTSEKHYGPRKSRTQNPKDPGLLSGFQFIIIGSSPGLVPDDLEALIVACGGSVVSSPQQYDRGSHRFIITCVDTEDSEEIIPPEDVLKFNKLYKRFQAVTVSRDWLLNSLTTYSIQPLKEYVLTTDKTLELPSLVHSMSSPQTKH